MEKLEKLWLLYSELKFKEIYMGIYLRYVIKIDNGIAVFCAVVASASIASLSLWKQLPQLWTALVITSQLVEIARPYMPFAKHRAALKFLLPETRELVNDLEYVFEAGAGKSDSYLVAKTIDFSKKYDNIEQKYLANDPVAEWKWLIRRANAEHSRFMLVHFGIAESEETTDATNQVHTIT